MPLDQKMIVKLITTGIKICIVAVPYFVLKYKDKKRSKALARFEELLELKNYESALWHLEKYIEDKPKDDVAYLYKGIIYKEMGSPEDAVEALNKSLELKKKNYRANKILGDIYSDNNQKELSIKYYDEAIKIEKNAIAYFNRGVALYELNQMEKSRKSLLDGLKKADNDELKKLIMSQLIYVYADLEDEKNIRKFSKKLEKMTS